MTPLLRAELLKLRSVQMPRWLLLTSLGLVVLLVLVTVPTRGATGGAVSLHDADLLARVVGVGASGGEVVLLVLGILAITQELRFGTATATFLVTPARRPVLVAKAFALMLTGLAFAVADMGLTVVLSVALIHARGGALVWSGEVAGVLAGAVAVMALYAVVGVAIGALVRNQIAAVVGALVWLLVVEQLFVALLPAVGRWSFGGATAGLLQLGREATTNGALLPAWAAGLVLAAYAAGFGLLATTLALRRDLP